MSNYHPHTRTRTNAWLSVPLILVVRTASQPASDALHLSISRVHASEIIAGWRASFAARNATQRDALVSLWVIDALSGQAKFRRCRSHPAK